MATKISYSPLLPGEEEALEKYGAVDVTPTTQSTDVPVQKYDPSQGVMPLLPGEEEALEKYGAVDVRPSTYQATPSSGGIFSRAAQATGNFLGGAGEFFGGAGKFLGSAVSGASALGEEILSLGKAEPLGNELQEKYFTPQTPLEKGGFTAAEIGSYILPGMVAGKAGAAASAAIKATALPAWLSAATSAATQIALDAATTGATRLALSGGDVEQAKKEAKTAGIVSGVIRVVLPSFGWVAKESAKFLTSKLSGVPESAMEEAFKNPKAVSEAIEQAAQHGGDAPKHILDDAVGAIQDIKNSRNLAYRQAIEKIQADKNLPAELDLKGVQKVFDDTLKQFGRYKGGSDVVDNLNIPDSYKKEIGVIKKIVDTWDDLTPLGLDDLRETISSHMKSVSFTSNAADKKFNAILTIVKKNLSDHIGKEAPAIAAMNKAYAKESALIEDFITNLNLEAKPTTAMRTLMGIFNPKSRFMQPIAKELGEKASRDFVADIAGALMSRWTPEGLGAYLTAGATGAGAALKSGNLASVIGTFVGTMLASSPRLIGLTITTAGKIAPYAAKAEKAVETAIPAISRYLQD